MLKQIGELALVTLAVYSVRKPVVATFKAATECNNALDAFAQGGASGAMVVGSILSAPISAPVGAALMVRDAYRNRAQLKETAKALPQLAKDKASLAKNFVMGNSRKAKDAMSGWFTKDHEEKVAAAPELASAIIIIAR